MKKCLLFFFVFFGLCLSANCTTIYVQNDVNQYCIWEKSGIQEKKVINVANKIISSNKLKGRAPVFVDASRLVNAFSNKLTRDIHIFSNTLLYIDNDDELAYLLAHEIAHSMETYASPFRIISMTVTPKNYEFKADLVGIDYMVKAGYNPIAAITFGNKIFTEPYWDWGFTSSHPKGSRRLFAMYKHIYTKYPEYLNSSMVQNLSFTNYINTNNAKIKGFEQRQKIRAKKNNEKL